MSPPRWSSLGRLVSRPCSVDECCLDLQLWRSPQQRSRQRFSRTPRSSAAVPTRPCPKMSLNLVLVGACCGAGLPLLNYGEGLEVEGNDELQGSDPKASGLLSIPLCRNLSLSHPIVSFLPSTSVFLTSIAMLLPTFNRRLQSGNSQRCAPPSAPCHDHTANSRILKTVILIEPHSRTTTWRSARLSIPSRIVPIWKDTAIFVIEDDAQSGVDHVDAHRIRCLSSSYTAEDISRIATHEASVGEKRFISCSTLGPLNLKI